ncbi:hypothetical protein [Streptomyces sp. NPDC005953]|uniref:hypothetical protein n=1 Tax=Streptomyces sp. NPDC005953 TaxID=3156719 RepID=UPI0033EF0BAB
MFYVLWLQEMVADGLAVELMGPSTIVRLADGGGRWWTVAAAGKGRRVPATARLAKFP